MSNIRVLFVCLGNICRSPTAHGVFEHLVKQRGLHKSIETDSAGTGDWHIGRSPDVRTAQTAAAHGYDLSALRARQVRVDDFKHFDYVLAMDNSNLNDLQVMCPEDYQGELGLFLPYGDILETQVPDPYYGGDDGFTQVLSLVENASHGLLDYLIKKHKL
ncbi:MAG: low molecular weight phosphotyrosine protein phosphatase [Spongiibacteraceae bacterium]|nr:low molecular weight phosphotyrosine protein phosphatase [Spongiibacteraceae bacterium]